METSGPLTMDTKFASTFATESCSYHGLLGMPSVTRPEVLDPRLIKGEGGHEGNVQGNLSYTGPGIFSGNDSHADLADHADQEDHADMAEEGLLEKSMADPPEETSNTKRREIIANFKCCAHAYAKNKEEQKKSSKKNSDTSETLDSETKRSGCILQFSEEEVFQLQMQMKGLKEKEKDGIIKGLLLALHVRTGDFTEGTRKKPNPRKRARVSHYQIAGKHVCRDAFTHLLGISKEKLSAVRSDFMKNGVIPRKLHSGGRNSKAHSTVDTEHAVSFLNSLSEERAEFVSGRIPGFQHKDVRILPAALTTRAIYGLYVGATKQIPGMKIMSRSSFESTWKKCAPYIILSTRGMPNPKRLLQTGKTRLESFP